MQGKFPVIVDYRMSGIAAPLKPDDNIGFLCEEISNLAFSLIAPIGAYYRFDHYVYLLDFYITNQTQYALLSA
ncbi:hypothetical protein SDC9_77539 [bioreactor metagenome]|uniref:Uncharacterized protein n=1 Tax=bioreactor metagenome TaxID=1076179 RepID=A0A644YR39_9ZZZZ